MIQLSDTDAAARRRAYGDVHVSGARKDATLFDGPFRDLITDAAWGHVWARRTIPLPERSMMTIALLGGLGNDGELAQHFRTIPNTGTGREDVEALLHVAIHAGVPRTNHAIKLAKDIFAEAGTDAEGDAE